MTNPTLEIVDVVVEFRVGGGLSAKKRSILRAVDGVTLTVNPKETLGLVGESGSGKSTIARAALGLVKRQSGRVRISGREVAASGRFPRLLRREIQMVYQDPRSSLDPMMTIGQSVGEPLQVHDNLPRAEVSAKAVEALRTVGLSASHMSRYPHELSGGQCQRVTIARAIILRPKMMIFDEPTSSLDLSTRGAIVNVIRKLQEEYGQAYLLIAHDLSVIRHASDRTAVMYLGQIVETGPTAHVFAAPTHPYTLALLSAVPEPGRRREDRQHERLILESDPPSAINPPTGCRFRTRCPFAMKVCAEEEPRMRSVEHGGAVACHLHDAGPELAGGPVSELLVR